MNETNELLEYIYRSSEMGVVSLTNLLKELDNKENKLKPIISDELTKYEDFNKKSKKLLGKNKLKKNSSMVKMINKKGIKKEVESDNSDAKMAHLLIQGFTMGVVDIESKIKALDEKVEKDIVTLGNDYLKFQQEEINKLKKYL